MDNIFFTLSKLLWLLIKPDNVLVIGLSISIILFILKKDVIAKKLMYVFISLTLIIAIFPIGDWLIYPLETHFDTTAELPEKVDGIILLGGSFVTNTSQYWGKIQTNHFADRIYQFLALLKRYPNAKAIFTGGNADPFKNIPSEAHFAKQLFNNIGIQEGRILFEDKARNTYENALLSQAIANPKKGENWIVISTAWHLPRAVGIFCKQQWPVIPYPADFHTHPDYLFSPTLNLGDHINQLNFGIREWIGLVAYYLTGKTTAILPEQCH